MKLNQYVSQVKLEIDDPSINGQRRRHLQDELVLLDSYQRNHPEKEELPNALELFCNMNPEANECRIYEL